MKNILERIAGTKRQEVGALKAVVAPDVMLALAEAAASRPALSMAESVRSHPVAIIAEHKRRSPSRGEIAPMSSVADVAVGYASAGAAAMSVLTDTAYFGGSLTDLAVARAAAPSLPILRKEFIIDPYQIWQARVAGADAVLLIAALLPADTLRGLHAEAHRLGLQTLIEVHSPEEIDAVPDDADMVGVNNRDLTSFTTDISNSRALIEALPAGAVKIAESGIHSASDLMSLRSAGFDGFLIGEALMSNPSPAGALEAMISACSV